MNNDDASKAPKDPVEVQSGATLRGISTIGGFEERDGAGETEHDDGSIVVDQQTLGNTDSEFFTPICRPHFAPKFSYDDTYDVENENDEHGKMPGAWVISDEW